MDTIWEVVKMMNNSIIMILVLDSFRYVRPTLFFFILFFVFCFFYGEDKPSTSAQVRDAGKVGQELRLDALILFMIMGLSQAPLHTLPLTAGMLMRNI